MDAFPRPGRVQGTTSRLRRRILTLTRRAYARADAKRPGLERKTASAMAYRSVAEGLKLHRSNPPNVVRIEEVIRRKGLSE